MSHLAPIYDAWENNAEALGADIGESGVKVRQWRNRGNIPPRYWQRIITAAEKRGKQISLNDFLEPEVAVCSVCERRADQPETRSCTAADCGLSNRQAA